LGSEDHGSREPSGNVCQARRTPHTQAGAETRETDPQIGSSGGAACQPSRPNVFAKQPRPMRARRSAIPLDRQGALSRLPVLVLGLGLIQSVRHLLIGASHVEHGALGVGIV